MDDKFLADPATMKPTQTGRNDYISSGPVVKFKKLAENAKIPTLATEGDAGFDLTAIDYKYDEEMRCHVYDTGIAVAIPRGYMGLLLARSSISKTCMQITNHAGLIDSSYRGPIKVVMHTRDTNRKVWVEDPTDFRYGGDWRIRSNPRYEVGERIAQLVVVPCLTASEEVTELDETERGAGGFGHSGK